MEKMIPTSHKRSSFSYALRNGLKLSDTMHYAVLKRGREYDGENVQTAVKSATIRRR